MLRCGTSGVNALRFCVWLNLRSPAQLALPSHSPHCAVPGAVPVSQVEPLGALLAVVKGGGPISKTGACKIVPFRHSSGSESNHWTDAWLPRGSLMMVVTCSTYFSPSLLSLLLACAGCKGGEAALGALGTPLAATFLAGRFLTPFTCMRVQSLLCWKGQAAV